MPAPLAAPAGAVRRGHRQVQRRITAVATGTTHTMAVLPAVPVVHAIAVAVAGWILSPTPPNGTRMRRRCHGAVSYTHAPGPRGDVASGSGADSLRGFNFGKWLANAPAADREALVAQALDDAKTESVRILLAREPFADFEFALARSLQAGERKVVLVM